MIFDVIDSYHKSKEDYPKDSHWPTDSSRCMRALWYAWKAVPITNSTPVSSAYQMRMGNAVENMLIYDYKKGGGIVLAQQVPVILADSPGLKYPVRGKLDAIIFDGEIRGWEVKSSYGRYITSMKKSNDIPENALNQVLMYLNMGVNYERVDSYNTSLAYTLYNLLPSKLGTFNLTFFARDTGYRTEYTVHSDSDGGYKVFNSKSKPVKEGGDFSAHIKKFQEIELALATDEPPSRDRNMIIHDGKRRDKIWHVTKNGKEKILVSKPTSKYDDVKETCSDWDCAPEKCKWFDICWKGVL